MKNRKLLSLLVLVSAVVPFLAAGSFAQVTRYVVTNDDNPAFGGNTATFYTIESGSILLTQKAVVATGGTGLGSGYYASVRAAVLRSKIQSCVYIADSGSVPGDIASIDESTLSLVGRFQGSSSDTGTITMGISDLGFLYAGFTGSGKIGTFKEGSSCTLKFLGDTTAVGLNGGGIDGVKVHGDVLVGAYADGSIESFNISRGVPVSNGDEQFSTGNGQFGALPAGVDISSDGHWAIFGDATSGNTVVEVSDLSSGKLAQTVAYQIGTGLNSNNVALSPDETLLYISNQFSSQITSALFDASTGVLSPGCMSGVLRNSPTPRTVATRLTTGNGSSVYVAEGTGIGVVNVISTSTSCTLHEAPNSPISDPQSTTMFSLGVYPPRAF